MNKKVEFELVNARGMVERRQHVADVLLGTRETQAEALADLRSMTACVKEVWKHRHNISEMIDDETAGAYIEADKLFQLCLSWFVRADKAVARFGVAVSGRERIVKEVLGDANIFDVFKFSENG